MVLHIVNDYSGSSVYKNLVSKLDGQGLRQIIYVPIREKHLAGRNKIIMENGSDSNFIYSKILHKYLDKVFYKSKINRIVKDIESKIDLSKIDFIHAHTWYSDGGVAYELSKKYNIPYLVTVRNTDINLFLKYHIFYRIYGRKILTKSKKIVTISAVYAKRLCKDYRLKSVLAKLEKDLKVLPNGVDDFWLENALVKKRSKINERIIKLLYIGRFTKGKNVESLIMAVARLNSETIRYELTLIGGGGSREKNVLNLTNKYNFVHYNGKVSDLHELKKIYENADIFTMPSMSETFGLVFVEALLLGLPILYTENEGIDGAYENIGEKVTDSSIEQIEIKIKTLVDNISNYDFDINQIVRNHDWRLIAKEYLTIYNKS